MQQPTETRTTGDRSSSQGWEPTPSPASTSFAGMLAELTEPEQPSEVSSDEPMPASWRPAPSWNDDDLAKDVATLSYESALKAHARYRPSQATDRSLTQPDDAVPYSYGDASSYASAAAPQPLAQFPANVSPIPAMEPAATPAQNPSIYRAAPFERNLKNASITIRMSKAECAQLHRRAAEAGLTVSAYLRSCTFEAESLRAMVKDTMAQLRAVTTQAKPADSAPSRFRRLISWLARLLTPWNGAQRIVRA